MQSDAGFTVCPNSADAGLRTAAFSPDGAMVALGGDDGMVLIWDLAQCLYRFTPEELSDLGVELEPTV